MKIFSWYSRKKDDNKRGTLVSLSFLTIFFIGKAIVESGHLLLYIICLVLGIIAYYFFEFLQKKKIAKPASLGKVYAKKYPIIVQYAPPKGINPAEAGLLYNCSVEPTDLTSLIYQWKFENLIDIKTFKGENSEREYIKLIKKNDMPLTRPLFESEIFDSIFCMGDIKIIEGAFQLRYALMLEDLEYHGIKKGWLVSNEKRNKNNKDIIGKHNFKNEISLEMAIIGIFLLSLAFSVIMEGLGVSNNISVSFSEFIRFLVIVFCVIMCAILFCGKIDGRGKLKFTDKGARLASEVIGYSQFIKSCDENKIKLLLKEDPLFIDRTLPYATAFGMETEFLNKISPLKKDRNARYVRGEKVPSRISVLHYFIKENDNSFF